MSGGYDALALKEEDVTKMLTASTHLGSENLNYQNSSYVFKRRTDGIYFVYIIYYYFLSLQ